MSFTLLSLQNIRSIQSASLTLNPRFNVFYGANGSGKTSFLEAIYLLSRGHSFRTREALPLITHSQNFLTVSAQDITDRSIHLYKSLTTPTAVTINQAHCMRASELARHFPCQVFYQDIFQIIDAGPSVRRQVLDLGLFHVEQSYHMTLKSYQRCLKQRNVLLRQRAPAIQLDSWESQMSTYAEQLHALREPYITAWNTVFQTMLHRLTSLECTLVYYKGWDKKQAGLSLEECLRAQREQDYQQQYTHSGPHQADISFCIPNATAKHTLSRGQQKIILIALKLAQAELLNKPWIYLFDDVCNELDNAHVERLIKCCTEIPGQFFLTALDPKFMLYHLPEQQVSTFSIREGEIKVAC